MILLLLELISLSVTKDSFRWANIFKDTQPWNHAKFRRFFDLLLNHKMNFTARVLWVLDNFGREF